MLIEGRLMKHFKATRRSLLAAGLGVSVSPLLPALAARSGESAVIPDLSVCKDGLAIVITETAYHFGLSESEMLGPERRRDVVRSRHIGMFIAWMMTGRSLVEIGRRFGGRDHTTALNASRKIAQLAEQDPDVRDAIEAIGALCAEPMRSKGTKLTLIPLNASRLSHRLRDSSDSHGPWNVV
jgi:hypothetical protein